MRLLPPPTPDDGTRLTGELAWNEPDRPFRTAGPRAYPPAQHATPELLIWAHNQLRTELEQVRKLVEQVCRGGLDVHAARSAIHGLTLGQQAWTVGEYCETFCRMVTEHHTTEDRVSFPHLRRRDPELAPVLDRLGYEHRFIHGVVEQLDRALVALVGEPGADEPGAEGANEARKQLQQVVDLLTDTLLSHLSYEEKELLDPLARHNGW